MGEERRGAKEHVHVPIVGDDGIELQANALHLVVEAGLEEVRQVRPGRHVVGVAGHLGWGGGRVGLVYRLGLKNNNFGL